LVGVAGEGPDAAVTDVWPVDLRGW
jgi:hypothetical protein